MAVCGCVLLENLIPESRCLASGWIIDSDFYNGECVARDHPVEGFICDQLIAQRIITRSTN